ncbi:MAG: hypothetical protein Q9160_008798 [Pyrenula sp. 1 TL-2023]
MASFPYPQLDLSTTEIRVLRLEPAAKKEDPISCTLETTALNGGIEYEALSYVWGQEPPSQNIYLNTRAFSITPNLHLALQRMRCSSDSRSLWIDAICIDQSNVKERNHQVAQMRNIYARAKKLLIWLGDMDSDFTALIASTLAWGIAPNVPQWKLPEKNSSTIDAESRGVKKFSQNPWWGRMWVFQEFVVASGNPVVGIGGLWYPWEYVEHIPRYILREYAPKNDVNHENTTLAEVANFKTLSKVRSTYRENPGCITLDHLLKQTYGRSATDPRDNVFALLGLVSDAGGAFPVDYNMSTSEVYQKAMIMVFQTNGHLELLLYAFNIKNQKDLPSWCVDFSTNDWPESESFGKFQEILVAGPNYGFIRHVSESGSLTVRGRLVGGVDYFQNFSEPDTDNSQIDRIAIVDSFRRKMRDYEHAAYTALLRRLDESRIERILNGGEAWKTYFKGQDFSATKEFLKKAYKQNSGEEWTREDFPTDYVLFEQFFSRPGWETPWTRWSKDEGDALDRDSVLFTIFTLYSIATQPGPYSLLTTDTGYMARVDKEVEVSDILCTFYNCSKVAVLRPNPDGETYQLLDFAYLPDFDDNKLIPYDGGEGSQEFVLV